MLTVFTAQRVDHGGGDDRMRVSLSWLGAIEGGLQVCGIDEINDHREHRDPECIGFAVEFEQPDGPDQGDVGSIVMKIRTLDVYLNGAEERGWHDSALLRRWEIDAAPLERVAHAAWHLMDDSGELDTTDDNGVRDVQHSGVDHDRLSSALDDLEATGWNAHPEDD